VKFDQNPCIVKKKLDAKDGFGHAIYSGKKAIMKKAKATLKKSNNIKQKAKGSPLVARVEKSVKKLARGIVKAMSAKPAKKPQMKAAPKALSKTSPVKAHSKAVAPKSTPPAKTLPHKKAEPAKKAAPAASVKTAPKKEMTKKEVPTAKGAIASKTAGASPKGAAPAPALTKGKAAPIVAAVLTKTAKGKAEPKGKKLTGAQLAEHLEKMCRETACENLATTKGYCRLDYIKNWKKIKRKEMILKEGKLNQYIEELVSKYPEKYIDVIRQDLNTEVNFNKVIHDLELDESIDDLDYDGDSIDALIGGIKKEGEDFGDEDF
jgi:hypothetical protein